MDSQIASHRGVPRHGFGREFIVAVGAVQEGLSSLAVLSRGLDDPAKARPSLRVQGASRARESIFQVKAEGRLGLVRASGPGVRMPGCGPHPLCHILPGASVGWTEVASSLSTWPTVTPLPRDPLPIIPLSPHLYPRALPTGTNLDPRT